MFRTSARRRNSYRSSIFSQAQASSDSAFFMSVTTGCIRWGIRLNCESSTFLGSIRISLTSSGRLVIRIERIIALRQTDLPVPVRPAISRWGMSARSKTSGMPLASLPRNSGMRHSWNRSPTPAITSPSRTMLRWSLGTSMPTVVLPGIGATIRTLGTARAIARSSARLMIFDTRSPASSSISNWVMTGPVSIWTTRTW